jgi:GNAT superfamily N-acetyltransferase
MTINGFMLERLSAGNIFAAGKLSDSCLGEGMYPETLLLEIQKLPGHLFYLLMNQTKAIGFFYCYSCSMQQAANILKISETSIRAIARNGADSVGIFKSIGIAPAFRGQGLAEKLIRHFETELFGRFPISVILVPSWKQGGTVVAQTPLKREGYRYLCDAPNIWYDIATLRCPVCKQERCVCSASIFYKRRG